MRRQALVLALVPATLACGAGSPASPTFESPTGVVDAAQNDAQVGFAVCPDGMDASFGSIYRQMLSTSSCGANSSSCHSAVGASPSGVGNLLDFSMDAGGVYSELLGPDGGGLRSTNLDHPNVSVLRVAPGDAGASMLAIKITTTSTNDPQYGAGMPLTAPGSVCPAAVDAVKGWINAGAAPD